MKPNGAITYYVASFPEKEWTWCYSAREFERLLNSLFANHPIQTIYVDLNGYVNPLSGRYKPDAIDMSYLGGPVLLLSDRNAMLMSMEGTGLIRYKVFSAWEIRLRKQYGEDLVGRWVGTNCFFDVSDHRLTRKINHVTIEKVQVRGSDSWAFEPEGFNEFRAQQGSEKNDLPYEMTFVTDSVNIVFEADETEYYQIRFEKTESSLPER